MSPETLPLHAPLPPLGESQRATVDAAIAAHQSCEGPLLPILHAVQEALGYVPPACLPRIAHALNLSRAEVHGVVSFYHHFRSTPPGRQVLALCRAEACQSVGARALETHIRSRWGIDFGETSADGAVTLEAVYCLGNCACGPSAFIDGKLVGRLTPERIDALLASRERP
ncbi:formate dehydrogenase subunit gamma [Tahibacter amnicola]|uniref:NADH-quinone oxidoreductase subunit E n=1 Tax=Tahibacter amnicola TaxID=2976241 RepID=A0ABY6BE90_9GAMM|nr:formate dehydrogenase subunit gamma [Tahibacter amnicola]UXI67867.1 formate dehydrogenase subunit gamma [Tahibacter amnicola]